MRYKHIAIAISIIGLAVLLIMLNLTSPTEIGPFGVLLFFTTLYLSIFGICSILIYIYRHLALRQDSLRNKDYLYAAVLAFGPIMLLMARSFGAISLWTIGLIILFVTLAEFLVAKRV